MEKIFVQIYNICLRDKMYFINILYSSQMVENSILPVTAESHSLLKSVLVELLPVGIKLFQL